ncbi:helix-turn-helix domain-containing protein [Polaromonas sp. UC242_47]|uniref:helix-turn-helix domain-containing protein n=1 Tax=Polaromonas sp. UC242_47 TaxID=3374626 RepID=UPI0037902FA0
MSEFDGQLPGHNAMTQGESLSHLSTASAGTVLRQAREAAGLHIAALAVALKVPVKKLEALESDRLDELPDSVFVRALASSVCRTLKIDAAPVLALLPQTGKSRVGEQGPSINTPFRAPSDGPGPSLWAHVSRPAVLVGLLLLLGALVLIFLPAMQLQLKTDVLAAVPAADSGQMAAQPASPGVVTTTVDVPGSANAAVPDRPVEAVVVAPTLPAAPVSAPVLAVAAPAVPPPAASIAAVQVPAAAAGIIVFTAKGSSWVEVTDAKGMVVLRRTLAAGEAASASGALPLAAVVGRVDATLVQVRGQAFDLNAVSKDNVARFEVK